MTKEPRRLGVPATLGIADAQPNLRAGAGQHSIRVNDQFRVCFRWNGTDAENVEIVDYH